LKIDTDFFCELSARHFPLLQRGKWFAMGAVLLLAASSVQAQVKTESFKVDGDAIQTPLGGLTGDATRGRAIVANRQQGLCLLCHTGPIAEERFQGNLAPSLAGVGNRLSEGQLRLRMVNSRAINPETIMPGYYQTENRSRVGPAWQGRTILNAQQIEDVVAYLMTLRN
jgi:L-cysteine S-thiosulfotransferase